MNSISYYVKGLFRGVQETPEIEDQRLELETHISDRVSDLEKSGLSHEQAFEKAVSDLGDLDELIDTITGKKIFVPIHKIHFLEMTAGFCYGIIYLSLIFLSLFRDGAGISALYLSLAGFSGYLVPFILCLVFYLRKRNHMEAIIVPKNSVLITAIVGWLFISLVCLAANLLVNSALKTEGIWAWQPILGVLTWPVINTSRVLLVRHYEKKARKAD